jgi:ubiquinone biosynthesis monooxygenase Coq7
MSEQQQGLADRLVLSLDRALKTLSPGSSRARRRNPAHEQQRAPLDSHQERHAAGLMRVNHTGEVCAQALYQGQALTARRPELKAAMSQAADEEIDHLAWCEERLHELHSHTSVFNPAFYALSFGLGALAGIAGDRWSLGFVAATEDQVCEHLRDHLERLPANDDRSRHILQQMLDDEQQHADNARDAGAVHFTGPVKQAMTLVSRIMTESTYRL